MKTNYTYFSVPDNMMEHLGNIGYTRFESIPTTKEIKFSYPSIMGNIVVSDEELPDLEYLGVVSLKRVFKDGKLIECILSDKDLRAKKDMTSTIPTSIEIYGLVGGDDVELLTTITSRDPDGEFMAFCNELALSYDPENAARITTFIVYTDDSKELAEPFGYNELMRMLMYVKMRLGVRNDVINPDAL